MHFLNLSALNRFFNYDASAECWIHYGILWNVFFVMFYLLSSSPFCFVNECHEVSFKRNFAAMCVHDKNLATKTDCQSFIRNCTAWRSREYQTNGYPRIFYGIFCNVAGNAKKTKHYQFRSAVPLSNIRGHRCVKFPAFCNKVTARLNSWNGFAIKRFQIKLGGFAFVPVSNVKSKRYYIIKCCFGTKSKATSTSNVMDNVPMFSRICRNGKWTSSCNLSVTNSAPEWLHDSYINVFSVATVL